jgi:hypothetical protein
MATETELTGTEFTDALAQASAGKESPVADDTTIGGEADEVKQEVEVSEGENEQAEAPEESVETQPEPEDDTLERMREAARLVGIDVRDGDGPEEIALVAMRNMHAMRNAMAQQPPPKPEEPQKPAEEPEGWDLERHFESKWGVPEWKQEFVQAAEMGIVERDPKTNRWVPVAGMEQVAANVVGPMNQVEQARTKKWQELGNANLFKEVFNTIKEPTERMIRDQVQAILASQTQAKTEEQVVSEFREKNSAWMYKQNPVTGQNEFSEQGQKFAEVLRKYEPNWTGSQSDLLQIAVKMAGVATDPPAQPTTAATPKVETPAKGQKQQSFLQKAMAANQHSPSQSGSPAPAVETGVVSEDELSSLFVNALNASRR